MQLSQQSILVVLAPLETKKREPMRSFMLMHMVHIRHMRMRVPQPGMLVEMSVGIPRRV